MTVRSVLLSLTLTLTVGVGVGSATDVEAVPHSTMVAEVLYETPVRPAPSGAPSARIQSYTDFSRRANRLKVTDTVVDAADQITWVQVLLPGRPNGRRGWLSRDAVVLRKTPYRIRVHAKRRRVELFKAGKPIRRYVATVGTGGTPTPLGSFAIRDRFDAPTHPLGPYILVLTASSNVLKTFMGGNGEVAIHGWSSSVGQAASHGCVRLTRAAVTELAGFATEGTPVDVVND
ncbi:MAG: L,D-transpeptidase [Actinobacteria bacterium]|nr:L,D-transpeptidase [Actinomycetota bacterium]